MAQSTNSRRFYIDQGNEHTVVHCVPVHKASWETSSVESAATHQVQGPIAPIPAIDHTASNHLKSTHQRVSAMFRTARKRPSSSAS